jgi:hypothetical protein
LVELLKDLFDTIEIAIPEEKFMTRLDKNLLILFLATLLFGLESGAERRSRRAASCKKTDSGEYHCPVTIVGGKYGDDCYYWNQGNLVKWAKRELEKASQDYQCKLHLNIKHISDSGPNYGYYFSNESYALCSSPHSFRIKNEDTDRRLVLWNNCIETSMTIDGFEHVYWDKEY